MFEQHGAETEVEVLNLYTTTIGHQLVFCSLEAHHAAFAVILVIVNLLAYRTGGAEY